MEAAASRAVRDAEANFADPEPWDIASAILDAIIPLLDEQLIEYFDKGWDFGYLEARGDATCESARRSTTE
jgi:hypothetical protein